jgi:drug/metabolite transporter (DMT)-like permease
MRRVVLLAFIWGWSFLLIKVGLQGMTPATIAFGRVVLGLAVILVVLRARGVSLPRDARMWRHFAVMGLTSSILPFTLLAWSETHITSALTSVLNASTPLFAAIFAAVSLGERLRRTHLAGLALGFVGVAVAAGLAGGDVAGSSLVGVSATIAASACYGFGFAYARQHLQGVPALVSTGGQLLTATVIGFPAALLTSAHSGIHLHPRLVLAIVLLGVVGTGFAYLLNYRSISLIGPTKASLVTYLVPLVAVTVGVLFLSEQFHMRQIVGAVLTVVGISLLQDRFKSFRKVPLVGAMVALLAFSACSSSDNGGALGSSGTAKPGTCANVLTEPLDSRSTQHLLTGVTDPTYPSDPPTSGPHRVGVEPVGVVPSVLPRSDQVRILEGGGVILHYKGLSADDQRLLERQAGGDVRVMPNPDLTAPVVATAWQHKLVCQGLDLNALKSFVRSYAGANRRAD